MNNVSTIANNLLLSAGAYLGQCFSILFFPSFFNKALEDYRGLKIAVTGVCE